jgi:hypothetical protein
VSAATGVSSLLCALGDISILRRHGERHATAHEECRTPLEYKYAAYASWGLQDRTTQGSFEDFARDRFIIGDKGSVKDRAVSRASGC